RCCDCTSESAPNRSSGPSWWWAAWSSPASPRTEMWCPPSAVSRIGAPGRNSLRTTTRRYRSMSETTGHAIDALFVEERRYPPPADFAAKANATADIYDRDPDEFWETEARSRISWSTPFQKLYEWDLPYAKWFLGGRLNACYNSVD